MVGRPKTTGIFKTREELIDEICFRFQCTNKKLWQIAVHCGISETTADSLYKEYISKWNARTSLKTHWDITEDGLNVLHRMALERLPATFTKGKVYMGAQYAGDYETFLSLVGRGFLVGDGGNRLILKEEHVDIIRRALR